MSSRDEPPAIEMTGVSKSFRDVHVLREFDFTVASGERVAIIGRSGSGKTTLLRLLMTLERPDTGRILIHGEPLNTLKSDVSGVERKRLPDVRQVRGKIGMVFQHFNLFPHMTALANIIEAPIHVLREPRDKASRRGLDLLSKVGLSDKADVYPRQLSGGQQQRVAIARALAMNPQIMLFDEVTSALDPELVGEVLDVIRNIARDQQMTMLIVTHEMSFARDIADRVVFMDQGKIAEEGPPTVIFTNPANERTRLFLRALLDH